MMPDRLDNDFSILIVDDEPKNIQLLGNLLRNNHYSVEFATSGEEAIDWIYHKPFDLILLDIMMPGMNGYDVCRKIKADITRKHIPIIFLTAKTESEDIVKGFEVGGSDYVTKPFRPLELLARIKVHVEMKTLRGLLPICSNCRKIRNDKGVWQKIETYIEQHSLALFSHGMCPECMERLYGNEDWYKDGKIKIKPFEPS
jgi:DNA-binding response OmpR family regulator